MAGDKIYHLGFSYCGGIGPMKFGSLMKYFGNAEKAYLARPSQLEKVLGKKLTEHFVNFRSGFDGQKKLIELTEQNTTVLCQEDKNYPPQLKNISDPPLCLYIKGSVNNFDFGHDYFFAVVGTIKPTPYGIQVAKKFSLDLASGGFTIISGLAVGIDTSAHWGALTASGKTIAVLGCGVDVIYPPTNRELYYQIIKKGGLIISEFPPDRTVVPGLFVSRNRLISGLSCGVLVVEGLQDSGGLITARCAVEQGKEVFAAPGPITSPMSVAPNSLLKQGAKLVTKIDDILEEFNLKTITKKKKILSVTLSTEEKTLLSLIENNAKQVDEIVEETAMPINKILNLLSVLEIKGVIEKNSEGKYQGSGCL